MPHPHLVFQGLAFAATLLPYQVSGTQPGRLCLLPGGRYHASLLVSFN